MNSDVKSEALRLLDIHKNNEGLFNKSDLPPNWKANVKEALKLPTPTADTKLLPLMKQFVLSANQIFAPQQAKALGVDIPTSAKVATEQKNLRQGSNIMSDVVDEKAGGLTGTTSDKTGPVSTTPNNQNVVLSNISPRIKMNDPAEKKRFPLEIEDFDALDDTTDVFHCSGLSELVCDPWKFETVTEKTNRKLADISYKYTIEKEGDHGVRVRIWQIINYNDIEHFWTYKYHICCCRWFWGKFRFPGDCRAMYISVEEGDKVVPPEKAEPQVRLVFDELVTDWVAEFEDIIKNLLKSAGSSAGGAIGGAVSGPIKGIADPIGEELKKKIMEKLGLKDNSQSGSSGSTGSSSSTSSGSTK